MVSGAGQIKAVYFNRYKMDGAIKTPIGWYAEHKSGTKWFLGKNAHEAAKTIATDYALKLQHGGN